MPISAARCLLAASIIACASVASADSWRIIDLGAGDFSQARGINSRGDITGPYFVGARNAFLRPASTAELINIGTLGRETGAHDINNRQWIVGWSVPARDAGVAILWKPESGIQRVGRLPGHRGTSEAHAINNRGEVVGWSCCSKDGAAAFIWSEARGVQDLGSLGRSDDPFSPDGAYAEDINDRGFAVGSSETAAGPQHAFLWSRRRGMIDLGTLGGSFSSAFGINNKNQVVGVSKTAAGPQHAFLWSKGEMMDLGTLGGDGSGAQAVNDGGQVVGTSTLASGVGRAFIWTAQDGMVALPSLTENGGSGAIDINDRGTIVGTSTNANGWATAVMWVRTNE
jgi:probable HAF family extracellular repeat protein